MAAQLRFRTLLAGTAIAGLALTGCAQGGGDEGGGGESQSTPSSTPTPEAPADYTTEQVVDTLGAATVDGQPLTEVSSMEDALGGEITDEGISMMETLLEDAEIEPSECQDPLLGSLTGGMLSDVMADSATGTTADGLTITAFPMDSAEAADQHVTDLRHAYEQCGDVTLELMGEEMSIATTTEDADVEGAGAAISQTAETEVQGESTTSSTAMMSVGNVVIAVSDPGAGMNGEEGADEGADHTPVLEEIAPTFIEGPAQPSEGASDESSADASGGASDEASGSAS